MNGLEVERILSLIEETSTISREELLQYVAAHKDEILQQLRETGESEIPVPGGEPLVLRNAA